MVQLDLGMRLGLLTPGASACLTHFLCTGQLWRGGPGVLVCSCLHPGVPRCVLQLCGGGALHLSEAPGSPAGPLEHSVPLGAGTRLPGAWWD